MPPAEFLRLRVCEGTQSLRGTGRCKRRTAKQVGRQLHPRFRGLLGSTLRLLCPQGYNNADSY